MAIFPGTANDDVIITTAGTDTVTGLAGNDWIVVTSDFAQTTTGADVINGGTGIDTVSFGTAGPVRIDLNKTGVQIIPTGSVTLSGIENIFGSSGSDRIIGDAGANTFWGAAGNDFLNGAKGNDYLIGGLGNDYYVGGTGTDIASFQDKDNSNVSNPDETGVTVDLRIAGYQDTGEGRDKFVGIEDLFGSQFDDRLTGNSRTNQLNGGEGDDVIDGGAGQDRLTGGGGADIFVFGTENAAVTGTARGDFIEDFSSGNDAIDLSEFSADNDAFGFASLVIRQASGNTIVEFSDGANAFYRLTLQGQIALTSDDFLI
jgi:Ca2+-binding RTX toxin-like protein